MDRQSENYSYDHFTTREAEDAFTDNRHTVATALQRTAENQAFLSELSERILPLKDAESILNEVVGRIGQYLGVNRCHFAEIDPERGVMKLRYGYTHAVNNLVGKDWRLLDFGPEESWQLLRQGKSITIPDTTLDPATSLHFTTTYQPLEVAAFVAVPCMSGGEFVAVLIVDNKTPRPWAQEEVVMLESIAHRTWLAIENARLYRAAQDELKQRREIEKALRESEIRFRTLFENSRDAIGVGQKGKVLFVNQAFADLLGLPSPDIMIGRAILDSVAPEDVERLLELNQRRSRGEEVPNLYTYRALRQDGTRIEIENHVTTYELNGEDYTLVLARDVTARRQAEQMLQETAALLEATNIRLRRAMTETHHRVKNNLQVIAAMIDLQTIDKGEMLPTSEFRRLSQHVRALAMVHDLLTEQAKDDGEAHILSAKRVLEKLFPLLQQMAGHRRVDFDVEDATLLGRQATSLALIANEVCSNAIKYGRARVKIGFHVEEGSASLQVEDDGPGFPEGFDPVASANTGLELVQDLTSWDLRGQATFENHPDGGGRVTIRFPLSTVVGL